MSEPLYYAEDGKVWKRPIKTDNADGSTSISIGFPVCVMHDAVGAEAAESVAALMNAGEMAPNLLGALKAAEEWLSGWATAEPYLSKIRAAILKATGTPSPDNG